MSAATYPRGSGGCVLYPGSWVRIHGMKKDKSLNGREGEVRELNPRNGRLHCLLNGGTIMAFKPGNLQKIKRPVDDPEVEKVLEAFQHFDTNGDGVLEINEFETFLKRLGLEGAMLRAFLDAVDKDGDGEVEYEEFCRWALGKTQKASTAKYFPELQHDIADSIDKADLSDDDMEDERELTLEDVEKALSGDLPDDWPDHGVKLANNMQQRFPEYPLVDILAKMQEQGYVGGLVIRAIQRTGAKEVEVIPPAAVKISGAFPAQYRNRSSNGALRVYQEAGRDFSFQNMRDGRLRAVGTIPVGDRFQVLEARRGNEYGFCFGRIAWNGRELPKHWVVLGIEMGGGKATDWRRADRERKSENMSFSDAVRLE
eukprot:TRINITY_DN26106_c0_g1_i1.p1 TRINITY_DN26106_c0_g1~~TRINITY_DN26106_c0_g1_i1.p1  ORF type:complete len:370 (-),score=65.35 TRINITY_DN26106_c0_g1_i1:20-1129(-)